MAREVWEKVQAAEAEARRIIEEAKHMRVSELGNSRKTAAELIERAEAEARENGERLLTQQSAVFEAAKPERLSTLNAEIQGLIRRSEKRIAGAVKMIVEKVVS